MASRGIQVVITGEYNDKDVKKAMGDLKALQSGAHETGGAFNLVGENLSGFGSKLKSGFMEPLAGVGAAIGATFALEKVGEFFKSSIEAAMEDEKALRSLAITMRNVGDATPIKEVTEFVDKLAEQTGVAKEQLIPAYQRLLTVTGDAEKSQQSLKLAMDISAGTGRDLETVTLALSKGFAGSTVGLSRLGAGLDKSILQTGDMATITQALSDKFQGQAAAAADTYSGKLARISVAANQAKEDIGYALLGALDSLANTLGGTNGAIGLISGLGTTLAETITEAGNTATSLRSLGAAMLSLVGSSNGADQEQQFFNNALQATKDTIENQLLGPLGAAQKAYDRFRNSTQAAVDPQEQTNQALSIYVTNAEAARIGSINLANGIAGAADAASGAADDLMKASIAAATFAVTSGGRSTSTVYTGGTPTSGYGEKYFQDSISQTLSAYKAMQDAAGRAASGGGGAAKQASDTIKMVAIDYAKAAADINKSLKGLSVSISGDGGKVTQALADEFKARTDTFKSAVSEQLGIIKSAQDAISSYSDSISSSILGQLSFKTAAKDAEGNDVSLSPDAIAKLMLGDIANQSKAVGKIAGIALKLPDALTKQILALPSDAAIALADYLSANPDMTQRLADNYQALADQTKTLLGDPMAQAFATVGGESAVALIAGAREAIAAASDEFQAWAANALHVTITMDTSSVAPAAAAAAGDALSMSLEEIGRRVSALDTGFGLSAPMDAATARRIAMTGRASGGSVTGGTPYMVGENGPEVFVPGIDGTIIPNGGMAGGSGNSGNTYAITVNSGVGDPRQIGQQVVQYIRQFEQSSGRVFAKA